MNAVSPSSGILEAMKSQVQRAETLLGVRYLIRVKRQNDKIQKDKNTKRQENEKTKEGGYLVGGEVAGVADGLLHAAAEEGVEELGEGAGESDDGEGGKAGAPSSKSSSQLEEN